MKWLWKLVDRIVEKEVVSRLLEENAALKAKVAKLTANNSESVKCLCRRPAEVHMCISCFNKSTSAGTKVYKTA